MALEGSCFCGAVQYQCQTPAAFAGNCHCRSCQKLTGSGYGPTFFVAEATILIEGEVKYFHHINENGQSSQHGFCPQCGSNLFGKSSKLPDMIGIRAGTLNDPSQFQPQMDLFTSRANHWDFMNPALPKFPELPPMA